MTRLKVAVRVRPLSNREVEAGSTSVVDVENGDTLAITNIKVPEQNAGDSRERVRRFTFDYCFRENATQESVFDAIEKVIGQSLKQRFHSCVLAYGQSSSGKTHTMMGFPNDPGLTPKLCDRVFDYLEETAVGQEMMEMKVTVSYLEIYNEKVKDLLGPENLSDKNLKRNLPLKIREHPKKGPYVQGLSEHPVTNSSDLLEWLEKGNRRRRVAATLTNVQSSRSHSVFSVNCDGVKLNLIDLAGSERAGSRYFNLSRFKEGANINKSLVALGNVISALAEQTSKQAKGIRRRFVPYRDSVLTWLLKDTLGGNSNTVMVATVSPSNACYSETVNTLRFGQRAKLIVSRPVVNEDPKEKTIRELRAEIFRLKELLTGLQCPQYLSPNPMNALIDISIGKIRPTETISSENESGFETNLTSNDGQTSSDRNETVAKELSLEEVDARFESPNTTTEKLLPLINVSSTVKQNRPTKLRRTFSVDHNLLKMEKEKQKLFGSSDSIPSTSTKSLVSTPSSEKEFITSSDKSRNSSITTQSLMRRRSLNKAVPPLLPKTTPKRGSLEETPKKMEKAVSTENLHNKKIESKVDSIRKRPVRPRSHIVAAVTSRLYSKTKKKEVATDTSDIEVYQNEVPKELKICTNARQKLRDLTRKALKAHRSKNEETQTDLFPVRRVKETSTDMSDLQIVLAEVKEVGTMSEEVEMKDASVECTFLNKFGKQDTKNNRLNFTRSCGTQSMEVTDETKEKKNVQHPISFTKYLRDLEQDVSSGPIYTNSFNISISNNYLDGNRINVSTSEDSLEEGTRQNVGLPTPDLISNHNSLEHHNHSPPESSTKEIKILPKLLHETVEELQEQFPVNKMLAVPEDKFKIFAAARCNVVPRTAQEVPAVNLLRTYAPEVCINKVSEEESCAPLPKFQPKLTRAMLTESEDRSAEKYVVLKEPLVLKSIVKENGEEDVQFKADIPDSLEYHMANKKVKFSEHPSQEKRMIKAMSEFLEEATQLMSKIDRCSSTLFDQDYEVEVTVNDVRGLRRPTKKTRRKLERPRSAIVASSQHDKYKCDSSTQCDDSYSIPVNKYEALLEDTCRRLEEKIQRIPSTQPRERIDDDDIDANTDVEDSSLESNAVAFSDYGSLPRRTHKRYRRPACSPSAFLKQLTNMRRQVIKSSREDLMSSTCNH